MLSSNNTLLDSKNDEAAAILSNTSSSTQISGFGQVLDSRSMFHISRCIDLQVFDGIYKSSNNQTLSNDANEHSIYSAKMVIRWVVVFGTIVFILLELAIVCGVYISFSIPSKCGQFAQCLMKLCPLVSTFGYLLIQFLKWDMSDRWLAVGGAPTFPINWIIAEVCYDRLFVLIFL